MKTARQNCVNQSENGYGWDNYTDYELSIAIHSIKCFEMQDTNEKLRLTCRVTAAHCYWSRARSESDDWPAHTRFKGKLNSWHRALQIWFISSKVTAYKYWVSGITCHMYSREERTTHWWNKLYVCVYPGCITLLPKIVTREELQGPAYHFVRISGKRGVSAY